MEIIVYGARGDVGSRAVRETLSRGHDIIAVVRSEGLGTTDGDAGFEIIL